MIRRIDYSHTPTSLHGDRHVPYHSNLCARGVLVNLRDISNV